MEGIGKYHIYFFKESQLKVHLTSLYNHFRMSKIIKILMKGGKFKCTENTCTRKDRMTYTCVSVLE